MDPGAPTRCRAQEQKDRQAEHEGRCQVDDGGKREEIVRAGTVGNEEVTLSRHDLEDRLGKGECR